MFTVSIFSVRRMSALSSLLPIVFASCFLMARAYAQDLDTVAAHFKINAVQQKLTVRPDATYVQETFFERQALSEHGAQLIGKYAQFVNKDLDTLEILEAYTQKADGRKLEVDKSAVMVQQGVAASGLGASWPGVAIHQITFPDVQKTDTTVLRLRTTANTPKLPGWMAFSDFVIPTLEIRNVSVRIEAPTSLKLQVFADQFAAKAKQSSAGIDVWEYSIQQPEARAMDTQPANSLVSFPRVMASTLSDSAQLADLFGQALLSKVVGNPELEQLARQLTEGKNSNSEKVAAIYDWVRKNIRYVAIYLGTGGWVPHDLDWILKNRYGDCKDHVLIMISLLKAAGIEAAPVLINTVNEYALPEVALGFNHAITYIPSLHLFADPTDARIPFGALPWADSDKPVAVALAGGGRLMRTPYYSPGSSSFQIRTQLHVSKDGKAKGTMALSAQGLAATTVQDHLEGIPAGFAGIAVQKILESSKWRGRGFLVHPPVSRDAQQQSFKVNDLEIDNLIPDPSGGSINPHPQVNLPMYISRSMGDYTVPKRQYAVACEPITMREDFELSFDPAFQIIRIPANFMESHPDGIHFEAQYRREGNAVIGWREISLTQPRHVCSSDQYNERQPVMQRIAQHLRSGILFQQ